MDRRGSYNGRNKYKKKLRKEYMKLQDKNIVITGGSEGLGFSLAKKMIEKGANVHILARTEEKVDQAVAKLGDKAMGHIVDISKLSEVEKVASQIESVDVLINNAGVWLEGSIADNTGEEISNAIDTNLKGVIYASKAFLPKLEKDEEAHILNISSTSGLRGRDGQAVYVASKFGVTGFTEALKADLANTNIKVTGFYPGGMSTSLFEKAGTPKENADWMDTDKVADIIVYMIEQDASMMMDHVVLNKRKTKTSN